ncbi:MULTISPECIES: outer membrane protein assembly factor BamA [Ralstonia solanacearum species complex]|uniref:Outer membrane protein assembly factor BamA n=2 Tax=Ralstonia solanacearum species complex TaxID=3116862 RepID=A0AAD0WG56_RALSL|nr:MULTISPECIES: outer membrane protein assembly factor BamA [Ralstonia solanacearum species complex]BEU72261.1 outer membrane protein assembly factor BamA [Ralstonia pseudosolanacearum]AMP37755.1 outer membrane protein assembly factor BamA [Ralstonia solanacearum]AXV77141.1 outer membrane protein assembly factor BamA [Ralstonia solanacearum]AXV81710.1 outer membrane protein assembly factor BamA [Ralstonia solanacearum]AXV86579.1 outer membrane protein assembly factor BamA [Ralstonia solanacea
MIRQHRFPLSVLAASVLTVCAGQAHAVEPFVIKDIRVEGVQRVEPGTVFGYLPVKVGETFTDDKGAESIRALYNTGFFKDVQIRAEGNVLVVRVEERPAISQLEFIGIKEFDKDTLRRSLRGVGVAEARYYDKSLIDRAEQELKRQYVSRGYYAADVQTTVTPVDANRVAVTFTVDEGPVAKIRQINIVGNKAFSEGDLRDEMQLSTPNWLSWYTKNDLYSKQKLTADLEALRSFYLDRGYLEFAIESTQVSITPDKKDIYLTLNIHEGEQYKVSDIKLTGELLSKQAEMEKLIKLKPGDVFSSAKLSATTKAITDLLGTYGYAFATINPQPQIDQKSRTVALTLVVDPGRRVYVRRVNVVGNSKTRDEVVRREMRQMESSWFDGEKLQLSQNRINRTGYFTDTNITTEDVPGTSDQVDVNVNVTEKPTGQISLGVGFSSTDKLVLSAGIRQDNVFGSGTSLGLDVNTSKSNRTIAVTQYDPYFTVDGISRSTELYYRTYRPLYYTGDQDYRIVQQGGNIKFGVPFSETDTVFFGIGYERTTIDVTSNTPLVYQNYVAKNGRISNNFPITIGWSKDQRDSALVPTRGRYQQANLEIGIPGGDLQYYRAYYQHQYFYPVSKSFTLAFNNEIGYGHGYGGKDFPVFKNYYAGGIGSVRGYETSTLGPRDANGVAIGGASKFVGNMEFIFPLPGSGVDRTVRLFTFFDYGNVFAEGQPFKVGDMRYSTGFGLSWLSPIGPLKISMGFPIKKKAQDQAQRFQFQIGTAF